MKDRRLIKNEVDTHWNGQNSENYLERIIYIISFVPFLYSGQSRWQLSVMRSVTKSSMESFEK
jgi:hypothetical protein